MALKRGVKMHKLERDFYAQDTVVVAKALLGKLLVHRVDGIQYIAKIVETEAYVGPHDLAAHSSRGLTKRTQVMFGPPGYAYVYLIYGMYNCMNVVTQAQGHASAVLIRAVEPVLNITKSTRGPGLLCKAMQIDRALNAHDLLSDDFFVAENDDGKKLTIVKSKRIGVAYAKHWAHRLLRFYVKGNEFVSR
jgi:DNA-3-methyladenine glycosylase